MLGNRFLWFLLVSVLAACQRQEQVSADALPGAGPPPSHHASSPAEPAAPEPGKGLLPAHDGKHKEIAVGGCDEYCEDPKNAFRNFARALFEAGEAGHPPLVRFIDTSELDDNGRKWGDQWAGQWLRGRLAERRASIEEWIAGYRNRVGALADKHALEEALAAGLELHRISSEEVEFLFFPPETEGSRGSPRWKIRVGLRGLEWLVKSIYDW
jgi:hypothetical protein